MSADDEAARKRKAEELRAQISKYRKKDHAGEESCAQEETPSKSPAGKSPREFVEERMRELDEEEQ